MAKQPGLSSLVCETKLSPSLWSQSLGNLKIDSPHSMLSFQIKQKKQQTNKGKMVYFQVRSQGVDDKQKEKFLAKLEYEKKRKRHFKRTQEDRVFMACCKQIWMENHHEQKSNVKINII